LLAAQELERRRGRKPKPKPKAAVPWRDTPAATLAKQEEVAGRPCPEFCEVCGQKNKTGKRLVFDHCHASGVFRGWLCHRCNVALGNVEDDPARLRALADYLERAAAARAP